jgi:argininosuccinate lyase
MPQKRNPFLLEHAQGRTTSTLGAFVSAITAMHSTPFTNSIAVGSEATRHVWQAMEDISDAALLTRLVIARTRPRSDLMLHRTVAGMTTATALANRIVSETECDFRAAHRLVGEMILHFIGNDVPYREDQISAYLQSRGLTVSLTGLDSVSVVESSEWGGGSGANSIERSLQSSYTQWADQVRRSRRLIVDWDRAKDHLEEAVKDVGHHKM